MALAEARAAWQRTANRCLVQEDAKRAPKLACCSSVPPSAKPAETGPTDATGGGVGQDIPDPNPSPFRRTPSYSNLSPNTKWWLQTRPNYRCQTDLTDETLSKEGNIDVARSEDDYELVSCEKKGDKVNEEGLRSMYRQSFHDSLRVEFEEDLEELRDMFIVSSEGSKSSGDYCFDSESSWVRTEKNIPWWRTADTEELAFLVSQKSLDLIENCDLPSPQSVNAKKNLSSNLSCLSHSEIAASLPLRKSGIHGSSTATSGGSSCRNSRMMSTDEESLSSPKIPQRDTPTHTSEDDVARARLLEALRHSQTRAREAEHVARQACAEKEHVVKLVFRQAQQLFAYKQWLHLLQLENMYHQLKNNKILSAAAGAAAPAASPWSWAGGARSRKVQKGWASSGGRNRGKRGRGRPRPRPSRCDVEKYAIVFALGLGLVGAGLLLGWSIGWMLPTCI